MSLELDGKQLLKDLDHLSQIGLSRSGGVNRVAFGPADLEARRWIESLMRDLGLGVTTDPAGNSIGHYPGQITGLSPIVLGSHTDTVPDGGRYDGALGVMSALACVRALTDAGKRLRHPVEVVNFAAEEATLGGTIGSRAMAGLLDLEMLNAATWNGTPVREHLQEAGLDPDAALQAQRAEGSLACYLELHVEQGSVLESAGLPLGVVEGIVGIRRYVVTFEGVANHAGTTPMADRLDALVMAAPFILAVRDTAVTNRVVGTVGTLQLRPSAPSVIPGWVEMSVETRGLSEGSLDDAGQQLSMAANQCGGKISEVSRKPPVQSDLRLLDALISTCGELGVPFQRLPSGAGHDAMCIAHIAPQAMLFVPSRGGISHSPDEFTDPESCVTGARVLLHAVLRIDSMLDNQQ